MEGISYGQDHEQLEQLLRSIDRPGNYCVGGRVYEPMPRVSVDGVGDLSFPVPEAQIEALIKAAERAPYGKGTKTLVDTSVRDCWQIAARQVRVTGRVWPKSFAKVLDQVATGLGLPVDRLRADLYKLLVYQPGGFFAAHRDTEKVAGMVATLSMSLPVAGAGGEMVVRHGEQEEIFDMSANEPSELAFAAFYADCLHEAKPVTSGHRVSLVFNLSLRSGNGRFQKVPDYAELVTPVAEYLAAWRDRAETNKLVWLLEHGYSEEGLSFETLKNTDVAVAQVLAEAAEKADCAMHAAVLRIEEIGDPEYGDGGWDWEPEVGTTMQEVHDRSVALEGWIAQDGACMPFGELNLNDGELLPWGVLDDAEPDEHMLEDYMGNYGPTLELSYRYAALVVWPRERTVDIVAGDNIGGAIAWAAKECARARDAGETTDRRILQRLSELWPTDQYDYQKKERAAMLRLLGAEDDGEVAADFVHRVVMAAYDGSENTELATVMPLLGSLGAGEFLLALVKEHLTRRPREVVTFLALVAGSGNRTADPEWREVLREAVGLALASMETALGAGSRTRGDKRMNHESVRNLFVLAWRLDLAAQAVPVARAMIDHPEIVTPDRMLPAALGEMQGHAGISGTTAYGALWRQAADFLLARSPATPSEPTDWTIAADTSCTCEHCAKLRMFCRDRVRRVERFSVRKDLRRHLHEIIEHYRLDLDHETERKGSPYTLVCTKNRASYKRRLEEYAEDLVHMHLLLTSAPKGDRREEAGRIARLEEALARGGGTG